jgi:excinuclease ABC subunit B
MGSLLTREDVIVVASVSCIYGLGSPEDYEGMMVPVWAASSSTATSSSTRWSGCSSSATTSPSARQIPRARRRGRGPSGLLDETAVRVEFFGDEIERISSIDTLTGKPDRAARKPHVFPGQAVRHPRRQDEAAIVAIREEARRAGRWFEKEGKLLEAQRLRMRTEYDWR